ncbi:MAG: sialate O-acetylesterase, partial [Alistipes sp.]|nr:sialate O-acetylesterase [Alistipes sp.]
MKHTLKTFALLLLSTLCPVAVTAALRLPHLVGDGMVLQCNAEASLWGWCSPHSEVRVETSWSDTAVTTHADAEGRWQLFVPTPDASFEARSITIAADGERIVLNDILTGEVWICAGQSNMEMPVRGFWSCPVEGAAEVLFTAAEYPGLRFATLPRTESDEPQEDALTCWRHCTPENAEWFSAVGTFFARRLGRGLNVPVGIIVCAWGGSTVEGWLPKDVAREFPDCAAREKAEYSFARPWLMYNGMFSPARRFTVRGFLWYQGCSNVGDHATYADRQCRMSELWRAR